MATIVSDNLDGFRHVGRALLNTRKEIGVCLALVAALGSVFVEIAHRQRLQNINSIVTAISAKHQGFNMTDNAYVTVCDGAGGANASRITAQIDANGRVVYKKGSPLLDPSVPTPACAGVQAGGTPRF